MSHRKGKKKRSKNNAMKKLVRCVVCGLVYDIARYPSGCYSCAEHFLNARLGRRT